MARLNHMHNPLSTRVNYVRYPLNKVHLAHFSHVILGQLFMLHYTLRNACARNEDHVHSLQVFKFLDQIGIVHDTVRGNIDNVDNTVSAGRT